jgi:hypothetical protein
MQLGTAAQAGLSVLIMGHIPPTLDSYTRKALWQQVYATAYWETVSRHAGTLAGQLFAHSHSNSFRVWGEPAVAAESESPSLLTLTSVSPIYGGNPAFFRASLGSGSGAGGSGGGSAADAATPLRLTDVQGYYTPLPNGTAAPQFVELYDARSTYGLSSLSNAAYSLLGAGFLSDVVPGAPWTRWASDFRARSPGTAPEETVGCDGGAACRLDFSCMVLHGLSEASYHACLEGGGAVSGELIAVACGGVTLALGALAALAHRRHARRARRKGGVGLAEVTPAAASAVR